MTNPLTVVEQITFLIFMKLLDDNQIMQERNANLLNTKLNDPVFKKGTCVIQTIRPSRRRMRTSAGRTSATRSHSRCTPPCATWCFRS